MASRDERLAVAQRLRKNATMRAAVLDYLGSEQVHSWWLLLYSIGCESNHQEIAFNLLADLIDPVGDETSFALDELSKDGEELYPTRWWRCARCGEETIMMYDEGEPVACPYCGARVVKRDA